MKQLKHQVNDLKEQITISDKRYHQSKVKCRICYFLMVVLLFVVAINDYESITYDVLCGYCEIYPSVLLFVVMIVCWLILFNEILNFFFETKTNCAVLARCCRRDNGIIFNIPIICDLCYESYLDMEV